MIIDTLSVGQEISEAAKKISQLRQVTDVLSSDMFVLARSDPRMTRPMIIKEREQPQDDFIVFLEDGYQEGVSSTYRYLFNEARNEVPGVRYENSFGITFGDIAKQTFGTVSTSINLGSMAFQESYDYSRTLHTHDYTKMMVSPVYDTASSLIEFEVGDDERSNPVRICMPEIKIEKPKSPYVIGEVKFLAKNGRTVDIDSPNFDGWVFADGKSYSKLDFPEAFSAFGGATFNTFVVPVISGFVRASVTGQNLTFRRYENHVPKHSHEDMRPQQIGDYEKQIVAKVQLPIYYSGSGSDKSTAMHTGYSTSGTYMSNLSVTTSVSQFTSLSTQTHAMAEVSEPKPRRNMFSAMVYIGQKARN